MALDGLALRGLPGFGFFGGAFEVEGEQTLQNLVVAQVCGPTVGGGHGSDFQAAGAQPGRLRGLNSVNSTERGQT